MAEVRFQDEGSKAAAAAIIHLCDVCFGAPCRNRSGEAPCAARLRKDPQCQICGKRRHEEAKPPDVGVIPVCVLEPKRPQSPSAV